MLKIGQDLMSIFIYIIKVISKSASHDFNIVTNFNHLTNTPLICCHFQLIGCLAKVVKYKGPHLKYD